MTTPTDAEIIFEAIDSRLLDVHTAIPCKVLSYNNSDQTADLQPQVKRAIRDENGNITSEALPILPDVPIAFPRSKDFFISFPVSEGDFVLCIFSESSIDVWRSQGKTNPPLLLDGDLVAPGDARRHSLTGGVAIPCCYPNDAALAESHANDMVMGHQGGAHINIKTGGTVEATSGGSHTSDDFVAMAGKVLTELQSVKTDLDNVKSEYDGHTHTTTATVSTGAPGVISGAGTISTPHTPGSVASSNLKADD
jgi:hypothetical protein